MSELPNAKFEDATDVIGVVRFIKSAEEIAWLRRSAEVADAGVDELIRLARPGVDAAMLWAGVTGQAFGAAQRIFSRWRSPSIRSTRKDPNATPIRPSANASKPYILCLPAKSARSAARS